MSVHTIDPSGESRPRQQADADRLRQRLRCADAWPPGAVTHSGIEVIETHISTVFLVGDHAYKFKKPVRNDFVDYSSLQKRHHYCIEEVRLGKRYCEALYVGVIPVVAGPAGPRVEARCIETPDAPASDCQPESGPVPNPGSQGRSGAAGPIEYAVKMKRFPAEDLLSHRLRARRVTGEEITQFAQRLAELHAGSRRVNAGCGDGDCATAELIRGLSEDSFRVLSESGDAQVAAARKPLQRWVEAEWRRLEDDFEQRRSDGFVRECHGDLHLDNIVHWQGRLVPFDGIEFNDRLRWIDVLADAAFVAMDLAAQGEDGASHLFLNAYLEDSGDYSSPRVLRWYLVDRAIIRAKVALLRMRQCESREQREECRRDCMNHLGLASRYAFASQSGRPSKLWITHGLSGSGKSTTSGWLVERAGAIRLRSDRERFRKGQASDRYSDAARHAVYVQMREVAREWLKSGFDIVVDATFLQRSQRDLFRFLAQCEGASFAILDCHADRDLLRARIRDRMSAGGDASEANLEVLDRQINNRQVLVGDELDHVLSITPNDGPESLNLSRRTGEADDG